MCCLGKYQAYVAYFVDKKAELSHFSKSTSHDGMTLGSQHLNVQPLGPLHHQRCSDNLLYCCLKPTWFKGTYFKLESRSRIFLN